jgi:hypothetical protein
LQFKPTGFYLGLALSLGAFFALSAWAFLPQAGLKGRPPIGSTGILRSLGRHAMDVLVNLLPITGFATRALSQTARNIYLPFRRWWGSAIEAGSSRLMGKRIWGWSFGLALLVYALSRFIGIDRYPIYFFTDEAIQANLAADLIRDHFHGADGMFLPTYFKNVYEYNLSLSVYLQLLPTYFLGKSVLVTRMASAVVTVFGAAAVGWCFSLLTGKRWAWLGVMLFGLMPAWFLHSRTAFETSLMVSMYAGFLYAYMRYAIRSPRFIFLVVVFAALTFYSYAPGQIIILTTSTFLLVADRHLHWANRRMLLLAIPLLVLLAIPYIRFQALLPGEHTNALRMLESHWVKEGSLISKLTTSLGYYLQGLNPAYWFTPNAKDLVRHQLDAFGHLLLPTAPLLALGLVLAWRRRREPAARVVSGALLSIPMAGVLVGVGITRVLSLVIPFALLSGLALVWLYERVRERASLILLAIATFILLAGIQAGMLTDALMRGSEYTDEYGMIGLQWGARELFEEIKQLQQRDPNLRIFLSPTWANGTDVLARFFLPDNNTLSIANAGGYLENMLDLDDGMLFVLTQPEVDQLRSNSKIDSVRVLDELHYPDGSPGFSFVTFAYSDEAVQIFAAEEAERLRPRVEKLAIQGQRVTLEYPYLDMGEVANLFDGDTFTLARVYDANPAILKLEFGEPRSIQGITLSTGSMDFELSIQALDVDGLELAITSGSYLGYPDDPTVELDFSDRVSNVSALIVEITSLTPGDPFKIHLRELEVR